MIVIPNQEAEFSGLYIAHWEVERVVVEVGRWFFDLLSKQEAWQPKFPTGFDLSGQAKLRADWICHPGLRFRIRFIGTPSNLGSFAHKGICCRRVEICKVIELQEIL